MLNFNTKKQTVALACPQRHGIKRHPELLVCCNTAELGFGLTSNVGHVPCDQKFRFESPKFSYVEWNQVRPDQSRSIPAWIHGHQELLGKMLNADCEKFNTHSEFNSSFIFAWRIEPDMCDERNLRTFLAGEHANQTNWPTGNSERPVHNFPGNQILTFSWRIGDQEQARTVARSSCIQCSVDSRD